MEVDIQQLKIFHINTTITEDSKHSIMVNFHSIFNEVLLEYSKDSNFTKNTKIICQGNKWSTKGIINASEESSFYIDRFIFHIELKELEEKTKYYFRLIVNEYISPIHEFHTSGYNDFSFLALCDCQYGLNTLSYQIINNLKKLMNNSNLLVCSGDLLDFADKEEEWINIIDNNDLNDLTLAVSPGDHEYWGDSRIKYLQYELPHTYLSMFKFPTNGANSSIGSNYYFVYNDVLFVSLDMNDSNHTSGIRFDDQVEWFKEVIIPLNSKYKFTIVFEHKSIFGSLIEDSGVGKYLRPIWHNLFKEAKVDLVISGHDHMYSRTKMIDGVYYLDMGTSGTKRRKLDSSLSINDGYHDRIIDIYSLEYSCGSIIDINNNCLEVKVYNQFNEVIDIFKKEK